MLISLKLTVVSPTKSEMQVYACFSITLPSYWIVLLSVIEYFEVFLRIWKAILSLSWNTHPIFSVKFLLL